MLTTYWGSAGAWLISWPETWSAWLLLAIYGFVFIGLIYKGRQELARLTNRRWLALFILSFLALSISQLFPLQKTQIVTTFLPLSPVNDGQIFLTLLSPVLYLVTGAILGPIPALFVGFFTGLGRSLGLTHQPYDPFHYAFAAWIAAYFMQKYYRGRLYLIMRSPVVNGVLSEGLILLLAAFVVFLSSGGSLLTSLDAAFYFTQEHLALILAQGLFGGIIAAVFVWLIRRWGNGPQLAPSPLQKSVQRRLKTDFLIYSSLLLSVSTMAIFVLSSHFISQQRATDMATLVDKTAEEIQEFETQLELNLLRIGVVEYLNRNDKASNQEALSRLYNSVQLYQRVILVDENMVVMNAYPIEGSTPTLTGQEQAAVTRAISEDLKTVVTNINPVEEHTISLVVPVSAGNAAGTKVVIGRLPAAELNGILSKLEKFTDQDVGLIIDPSGQIITHSEGFKLESTWTEPIDADAKILEISPDFQGVAYVVKNQQQARDLVYMSQQNAQAWKIAMVVPYTSVLGQALMISFSLLLVLVTVSAVSYTRLSNYSEDLTHPIDELSKASKTIASGGSLDTSIESNRQDEIGELSLAFTDMQRALKGRLDELSLLLAVSQDISSSIDIRDSLPAVLQGALRGTGASGARAVILSPHDGYPISIHEGPSGREMAIFDKTLMTLLRDQEELSLNSLRQLREVPDFAKIERFPVKSLYAVHLRTKNKFQGVLFLGFRQARERNWSERNLIRTLAGQASVLVENAHLYAIADRAQRRMAAVLASITEAVIVTDRTGRIFMINRALAKAFQLTSEGVIGRAVEDVIDSEELVRALKKEKNGTRNLEVVGKDRRIYYVNAATIVNQLGEIMGRVAVFHDITQLREIDRMKSDFVSSISHDMRTPLTVISGYATALSMVDDLTDEQRVYADNILAGVERMVGMVENLLDLGRIEAGVDLHFQRIDISELLHEMADEHWLFAHKAGVKLRVDVPDKLPLVSADRSLLERAISNLLTNGFKYAPNSGDMKLSAVLDGDELIISLRDRGPGIARLDQMHLFEKFYRVTRHGSGKIKGSGLGLAIVRSVAERHGGSAWCQSELGKGSTFYFSIPIESPKDLDSKIKLLG